MLAGQAAQAAASLSPSNAVSAPRARVGGASGATACTPADFRGLAALRDDALTRIACDGYVDFDPVAYGDVFFRDRTGQVLAGRSRRDRDRARSWQPFCTPRAFVRATVTERAWLLRWYD